jgi:sulfotransferase family protein
MPPQQDEQSAANRTDVPVVFVGGHGRSGSTLLSRVLDRVPGFCAVGELCYIWVQGVQMNRTCGCGRPFHSCPFWTSVGQHAFGGWDNVDAEEAGRLRRDVDRVRFIPLLARPSISPPAFRHRLARYADLMSRVYQGVRQASDCDVVIDTSKYPSTGYLLRQVPGVDVRLLHLVRSPHGVAYSWTKHKARPDREGKSLAQYPPAKTALDWTMFNAMLDGLSVLGVPSLRLRYEDFVAHPDLQVRQVLDFLGQRRTDSELSFVDADSVTLESDHSVAGNPMRFRTGREQLRLDEEWRTALPARSRRLVTALTAPGLLRYGYVRRG